MAKRPLSEQLRRDRRRALSVLANAYGEQLDDIGRMLVQAGILKASEVRRQGVRFALRDRLNPRVPRGVRAPRLSSATRS